MDNQTIRIKFNEYHKQNLEPRLLLVATEIGIDKSYLVNWKNGKVDISSEKLNKIDKFISKYKTL
ncbi:helix-turn-helix domain-containing protein [Staphylococcus xylosus]|uniref:helix-turn-helix domain-containing protein n=1 Tax=Staphylococcus xylosus TaxID=1288 RepID=UPI001CDD7AAE|nr:helix-turn-helix transcriptional regulator [Staphylococcus xylosus]MCA2504037.1 helix-turn-helix transcriptional regulator [Staphylococcus xylosus]MCE7781774.1 helix-turn-helix domain-containing protein [Staphylococcus xylosus]